MSKQETILVTGGAGFIGSHVVDRLVEDGFKVIVVDNLKTGKKENVNKKATLHKIDIVKDKKKLRKLIEKERPVVAFHLAAHKDVRNSVEHPSSDAKDNIMGTLNVLEAMRDFVGGRVVNVSSAAVYSSVAKLPVKEKAYIRPTSPYGISKRSAEMYVWVFSELNEMAGISLRFSNVYGPRETKGSSSVISIFINKILRGEKPTVYGSGTQTRDFIYVKDVAEALIRAKEICWCGEANIATNKETTINEVVDIINENLETEIEAEHVDAKDGELFQSRLDPSLAFEIMAWEAKVDVKEGIAETIKWNKEQYEKSKQRNNKKSRRNS